MYLIVDLEATCWKSREEHRSENEIIEIGSVVVSDNYEVLGRVDLNKAIQNLFRGESSLGQNLRQDFCHITAD